MAAAAPYRPEMPAFAGMTIRPGSEGLGKRREVAAFRPLAGPPHPLSVSLLVMPAKAGISSGARARVIGSRGAFSSGNAGLRRHDEHVYVQSDLLREHNKSCTSPSLFRAEIPASAGMTVERGQVTSSHPRCPAPSFIRPYLGASNAPAASHHPIVIPAKAGISRRVPASADEQHRASPARKFQLALG